MTTTPDSMPDPALQNQSTLLDDVNQATKKAHTTKSLKRHVLPIEKDESKLDTHECTTTAPPVKKKKQNTKESDSFIGDMEMMRQQNGTKETDELEIQELKETDEEQIKNPKSISEEIEELKKSWREVTEQVNKLEKQSNQPTPDIKSEIESLKNSINRLQTRQQKLFDEKKKFFDENKKLFDENKKLREEIATLKDQNKTIEARVKELEEHMKHIALGQLVTVLEKNLAEFVLQQYVKVGIFGCRSFMENWLKKNETNAKGKEGKEILDKLLKKVNWKEENWDVIKEIKYTRNLSAHPIVHLDEVKTAIDDLVPHWKDEMLGITSAFEKINCLMVLGRFSSNFKEIIDTSNPPTGCICKKVSVHKATRKNGKLEKKRWNTMLEGREWTHKHNDVLDEMAKQDRPKSILQAIDFDKAKNHVVDYITLEFKQQCFDIIDVMSKIPPEVWIEEKIVDEDFYVKNKQ